MRHYQFYPTSLNDRHIDDIASVVADGGIILYPTDTVPALGCDALSNSAIRELCRIKGVDPRRNTLSIICSGLSMASEYARIDNEAFRILRRNLPGPFTFILPAATTLPKVFKERRTVGIRIPDSPLPLALTERIGHPILSASAVSADNIGEPIDDIAASLQADIAAVADYATPPDDSGITDFSTVVDLTDSHNPVIVRQGKGELK